MLLTLAPLLVECGPLFRPVILHAYRWIIDSRDEMTGDRLDELKSFKFIAGYTIMNCAGAA